MQNVVHIQIIRPHKENLAPEIWPQDDVLFAVFIHYYFCVWQADGATGLPLLAAELNTLPPVSGLFAS